MSIETVTAAADRPVGVRTRPAAGLVVLLALSMGSGCGLLGFSPAGAPTGRGRGSDATAAAHFEPLVRGTECEADEADRSTKLAITALTGPRPPETIQAGMPCLSVLGSGAAAAPAPLATLPLIDPSGLAKTDLSAILDAMRKERVEVSVRIDERGQVEVKSHELERLQADLAGKPPPFPAAAAHVKKVMRMSAMSDLVSELRARLGFAGRAFREANLAAQMASARALSLVFHAVMAERHGGDVSSEAQRPRFERIVRAMRRSEDLAATATGLVATVQAAIDLGGQGKVVLEAARRLETALASPAHVAPTDAETLWKQGVDKATEMQAEIDDWSRSERAKRGMRSTPPSGFASLDGVLGTSADDGAASAISGVMALMAGDYGGALKSASALFPSDSPLRHGMRAAGAVLKGDYAGALASAEKMVPAGSGVAQALGAARTALQLVG